MKKFGKIIILTVVLLFSFILVSCTNNSPERVVSAIDIDSTTIPEYVEVGKYDITSSDIKITYNDGIVEYIDIDASMISEEDLAKLNTVGYHAITVNYDGFSTILNINVVGEDYIEPDVLINSVIDSISIPNKVSTNFNLETSKDGVSIEWTSDSRNIEIDGDIALVEQSVTSDITVILTATFKYQNITRTKEYTVVVEINKEAIVESVIESISVPSKVSTNFNLETSKNGVSITWEATPGYFRIENDGRVVVTRPTDKDVSVILTAKFYYQDIVKTKTYIVIVEKEVDDGSSTILVESVIESISVPSKVNANFNLETSKNGVSITWISDSNNIKITGNIASVTRSTSDVTVKLTATFKYQDVSISKIYSVVVEKKVSLPSSSYDGNYYDNVSLDLVGEALKQELRSLMLSTHKKYTTYKECKELLPNIDDDLSNPDNMILFYTGQSIVDSQDLNNDWNREHVWCQSLGWFKTSGAGSDLHHIRPCNISVNSSRGNKKYGVGGSYYTPTDEYKGDVARIIFYLMIAYKEADSYSFTSIAQSKELLLEWNRLDPVSTLEMVRNDRVEKIQGNRNPFIDYTYLADSIWG